MLLMIFVVLVIVGMLTGGMGHTRLGYLSWSPLAAVLALAVLLYVTGYLR